MSRTAAMKSMNEAIANCTDATARNILIKHRDGMPAAWAAEDAAAAAWSANYPGRPFRFMWND
jgi:hypothetical protein